MSQSQPTLLALDFDGVICDGLIEYFQAAWRAYCHIWPDADPQPPAGLAERFYALRPVVETGWEMPVVLRSLLLGVVDAEIVSHWGAIAQAQIAADGVTPAQLAAAVDGVRDAWIAADIDHWLAQHRFYPGVIERLQQLLSSAVYPVIVTTKEGRFVRQLLGQQGIELAASQIWGKEVRQPKAETLRQLIRQFDLEGTGAISVWFIEDRLKTLQMVQAEPDLRDVRLYLADWGYNLPAERDVATQDQRIRPLSLSQFAQDFCDWP